MQKANRMAVRNESALPIKSVSVSIQGAIRTWRDVAPGMTAAPQDFETGPGYVQLLVDGYLQDGTSIDGHRGYRHRNRRYRDVLITVGPEVWIDIGYVGNAARLS